METIRGQLLVATPLIESEPFHRSVVLLLDHDEDGALGVILNRQLDAEIDQIFPDLGDLVAGPTYLFHGGPVEMDSALALGILAGDDEPIGWRAMTGKIGLIDLDIPPAIIGHRIQAMRVFAGYAGWSPGQLETEIEEGSWIVVPLHPEDLVSKNPDNLWHEVLARQPGDVKLLSTFPDDPTLN